jgi:hypothetical protein
LLEQRDCCRSTAGGTGRLEKIPSFQSPVFMKTQKDRRCCFSLRNVGECAIFSGVESV